MLELLGRTVLAENLVPAEQVGRVIGFLQLVAVSSEAQTYLGLRLGARRADTGGGLNVPPSAQLGEDILETINTLLLPLSGRGGHFCHRPTVSRRVRVHLSLLLGFWRGGRLSH